jgi:formylglycine-generating enzyme required for sulfatase activity
LVEVGDFFDLLVDGAPWTTGDCSRRVLGGGSWVSLPSILRAAVRYAYTADNRLYNFGFRLGRTLTP